MSRISDRLAEDMKQAMKDRDKVKLSVIRMVRSSLQNEAIKRKKQLSDEDELTVLTREVKQRKDSLQEFKNAGRDDLAQGVNQELSILETYLPKQLTEDELEQTIIDTIAEIGATSKRDLGKVMGAVMPKVKGKADGNMVNKLVQKHLSHGS